MPTKISVVRICTPRISESSRAMTITEDRYRKLLGASSALAEQPTVKAVLQSLRGILSSTSRLHGAELYVLSDSGESLYSFEFDRDPDAPAIKRGAKLLLTGLVAQVLDEQKPVFVGDLSLAMLEHPDMAPFAAEVAGRSAYLFPVSTAQKRYGILSTPKLQGQQFASEDVEMLSALASHVAVALEGALARDTAELYHREVVKQRDRLSLLLEINNHIVNKLEAEELFQAVAGSMRRHLGNDLTSLWLFSKQSGSLQRRFLDFPTGKGFLDKVVVVEPTKLWSQWSHFRTPQYYSPCGAEIPPALREASRAESLLSAVMVPLMGADGPLGLLTMCSRRGDGFNEADRDLLSQI